MKHNQIISESIGWYGTIAIIIAFALVTFEILAPTNLLYLMMNITGSAGIIYISFKKKIYQPGVLNIIWLLIAVISVIKTLV